MTEATFGFRLPPYLKELMEQASAITRRRPSDFVRLAVEAEARRVIAKHERRNTTQSQPKDSAP